MRPPTIPVAFLLVAAVPALAAAPSSVKGTIARENQKAEIRYAYLFRGPDPDGDASKTIRRLYFSPTDLGATLRACGDMNCTSKPLFEPYAKGLYVDLIEGDWLRYQSQLPGFGMSGSIDPKGTLELTKDSPNRLAGTLRFDRAEQAGPTVDLTFDVPLTKELTRAREP
jgi:hypothetical protein